MCGKKRPLAVLWYQLYVSGVFIFKFTGIGDHPIRKTCNNKNGGLVRRGSSAAWTGAIFNISCTINDYDCTRLINNKKSLKEAVYNIPTL